MDARLEQRVPDRARAVAVDQQLDAVLARVARAADEHVRDAGDGERRGAEALGQLAVVEARRRARAPRALDGEHRVVVQGVVDLDVEAGGLLA